MPPPVTAPTHPPPPSESTTTTRPQQQQQPPPPPPPPPSGVESEAMPKKRKLEEQGFQRSPYYTIRETVANLRGRFLQVCQGTDSEKKDAAVEILNEMKDVIELTKKTRLDLSTAAEPVKPFDKPAARAPEDKRAEKVLSAEKNPVPPTSLAKKPAGPSKITGYTKQQGGLPQGSYVLGGSPTGWNFLMWPGSKAVYYGLTKAEWLARRSAK